MTLAVGVCERVGGRERTVVVVKSARDCAQKNSAVD